MVHARIQKMGLLRILKEALSKVWQQEAAPRDAVEDGPEEGLGVSAKDDKTSSDHRQHYVGDGRAVVPRNVSVNQDTQPLTQGVVPTLRSDNNNVPPPQFNSTFGLQNVEDSTAAESSRMSGTWSSGVVPAWPPSNTTFIDPFMSAKAAAVPYFIQWDGLSKAPTSWEFADEMNAMTLSLSLEDKALKGGALMQEFFNSSLVSISSLHITIYLSF